MNSNLIVLWWVCNPKFKYVKVIKRENEIRKNANRTEDERETFKTPSPFLLSMIVNSKF